MGRIHSSGSGEPGIYFSNDKDWGTNPCCEIALRPYQFCNLTEINVSSIKDEHDFYDDVRPLLSVLYKQDIPTSIILEKYGKRLQKRMHFWV